MRSNNAATRIETACLLDTLVDTGLHFYITRVARDHGAAPVASFADRENETARNSRPFRHDYSDALIEIAKRWGTLPLDSTRE